MMKIKTILITILSIIFLGGCNGPEFLGAQKYKYEQGMFVERWYLKPAYKKEDIPKDTGFYGAAANKIKHKFKIKYYIAERDGDSRVEIPKRDIRKVKRNDYLYVKTLENKYIKSTYAPGGLYDLKLIPIKQCYTNGWCKLYPTSYNKDLYYKRSRIY